MTETPILAWHFIGERLRDGSPVPADGETLTVEGPLVLCRNGLHASERLIDALQYAPGTVICRDECWGDVERDDDKLVCRHRRIVWRVDGEDLLRRFARRQALSVAHLWPMPRVVGEYLESGDESLGEAARGAVRHFITDAARRTSGNVMWGAAWGAAWLAAREDAWTDVWCAVWRSTRDAARRPSWNDADAMLTQMVEAAHARA